MGYRAGLLYIRGESGRWYTLISTEIIVNWLKIIVHCKIIFKLMGDDNGAESVGLTHWGRGFQIV